MGLGTGGKRMKRRREISEVVWNLIKQWMDAKMTGASVRGNIGWMDAKIRGRGCLIGSENWDTSCLRSVSGVV